MRVCADVIEGKHAFTRVTDDDLTPGQHACPHASRRKLGELQHGLEPRVGHGRAASNRALERNFSLEYGHGLADDPDAVDAALLEFQLDFDTAGSMHVGPLHSPERRPLLIDLAQS